MCGKKFNYPENNCVVCGKKVEEGINTDKTVIAMEKKRL